VPRTITAAAHTAGRSQQEPHYLDRAATSLAVLSAVAKLHSDDRLCRRRYDDVGTVERPGPPRPVVPRRRGRRCGGPQRGPPMDDDTSAPRDRRTCEHSACAEQKAPGKGARYCPAHRGQPAPSARRPATICPLPGCTEPRERGRGRQYCATHRATGPMCERHAQPKRAYSKKSSPNSISWVCTACRTEENRARRNGPDRSEILLRLTARRYEITDEEARRVLALGRCDVCGWRPGDDSTKQVLNVDHVDRPPVEIGGAVRKQVRGLLCTNCNHSAGKAAESWVRLLSLTWYVLRADLLWALTHRTFTPPRRRRHRR
jgi:hypothetical protein